MDALTMNKFIIFFFYTLFFIDVFASPTLTTAHPSFRQVKINGFTRARHDMVLSTEVSGKVAQLFADIGDTIPSDLKVACLDDTFVKIDIKTTRNLIVQHQIDIDYFQKQVDRYQKLLNKNSVAISQLDDFERQLGLSKAAKRQQQIQYERLKEKSQRHCILGSPDWRVMERYVELGQWIDVGTPVIKLGDYTQLSVPISISEQELISLSKESSKNLTVWLPDFNRRVPADIEYISPTFDEKTRKTLVNLLLKKDLPEHRGGLQVQLKLNIPDKTNTYLISEKAIQKRFEQIWVVRKNDQSIKVDLLGNAENGRVHIASPEIKPGDQFQILQP